MTTLEQQLQQQRPTIYRGRKMLPGKYVYDPIRCQFGTFIGYCDKCNYKMIVNQQHLARITHTTKRGDKGLRVRLLRIIMRSLRVEDL